MLLRLHLTTPINNQQLVDIILGSLIKNDQALPLEAKAFRSTLVDKIRKAATETTFIDLPVSHLCVLLNCLSNAVPLIGIVDIFEASLTIPEPESTVSPQPEQPASSEQVVTDS